VDNKLTSVKNPLTVIAIFAGIAEISGTAVLPLIAPGNQALYIWFLMLFPFALISLFFLTLNFNHRVLYAPSDFRDEDNFVNILKKSTYSEVLEYKEKEADAVVLEEVCESVPPQIESETAPQPPVQVTSNGAPFSPPRIEQWVTNAEAVLLGFDGATTRSQRNQMELIARQISERRMRDARLAEKLALETLEKELGVSIDREMKIEAGNSRFHFDGIARRGSSLTAIEVKYFRSRRSAQMNMMMWQDLRRSLESLYLSLTEEQRREFSFILVIVNDNDSDEIARMVAKRLNDLPFPTAIKLYDFDVLVTQNNSGPG
jgi:Holliday junction resolvase-like predicted endonuclease